MAPEPENLALYEQYLRDFNRQQLEHHRRLMREKDEELRRKLAFAKEKVKNRLEQAREREEEKRGERKEREARLQGENELAVGEDKCQRRSAPLGPDLADEARKAGVRKIIAATQEHAGLRDTPAQPPNIDPNDNSHAGGVTLRAKNTTQGASLEGPAAERINEPTDVPYQANNTQFRPPTPIPPLVFPEILEQGKMVRRAEARTEIREKTDARGEGNGRKVDEKEKREEEHQEEDDWDVITRRDANPLHINAQEEWAIIDDNDDGYVEVEMPLQQDLERRQSQEEEGKRSLTIPFQSQQMTTPTTQILAGRRKQLVRPAPMGKTSEDEKGPKGKDEKQSAEKEDWNDCRMPGAWD